MIFPDCVVFMPQNIAERSNFLPWLAGHEMDCHIAQLCGRLTDAFQAALDRIVGFAVCLECLQIHPFGMAENGLRVVNNIL
jgi:hypothetical protein